MTTLRNLVKAHDGLVKDLNGLEHGLFNALKGGLYKALKGVSKALEALLRPLLALTRPRDLFKLLRASLN